MSNFHVSIGDTVSFEKTVGESDIYLFAGITGDLSGNHVNDEYMRKSKYGRRIAHGALMIGFMSTCSTLMIDRSLMKSGPIDETPVSLGYDKIRFLGPVYINDTVKLTYTIQEIDTVKRQSKSQIEVKNQNGDLVAVGTHILRWVKNPAVAKAAE